MIASKYINQRLNLKQGDLLSASAIFDPIQTHALYGVKTDEIDGYKAKLQRLGADRFRIVKADNGTVTICFRLNQYRVLDKHYPPDEYKVCFEGFLEECERYVEEKINYSFGNKIILEIVKNL